MSLSNPRIDYITKRNAILTLLRNNITILNTDLTQRTFTDGNSQIIAGDPITVPIPNMLYPVIMVKLVRKSEEFTALGSQGRKRATLTFRIYAIVYDMSGTRTPASNAQDNEIGNLTDNIEKIFRQDTTGIQVNDNFVTCQPVSTDFGIGEIDQGVYCDISAIDLECNIDLR